jgi:hypothetical protein
VKRSTPRCVVCWRLDLPGGCTASVVERNGVPWWHLHQPQGAEVVGVAADVQDARILAVLAWRDATGQDTVPDDIRRAAMLGVPGGP